MTNASKYLKIQRYEQAWLRCQQGVSDGKKKSPCYELWGMLCIGKYLSTNL